MEAVKEMPKGMTDEHLDYLDDLRDSGVTNMFAAPSYLQNEFALDKKTSVAYWSYWAETFGDRHA
jgi:hypothetical protein